MIPGTPVFGGEIDASLPTGDLLEIAENSESDHSISAVGWDASQNFSLSVLKLVTVPF